MTQPHRVAILPTGDWAEVDNTDEVKFVSLDDKDFNRLQDGEIQACALYIGL